jgi:hypothetical protein
MMKCISWFVFLVVGIIIGLGAFGHGYSVVKVHEAIDQFPIAPPIYQTLFVVWYFVSGTMLAFGAMIVWISFRLKTGDASSLFVAYVIGAFYIVFGVCALIYRSGDPFWALFIVLGVLLEGSSFALRAGQSSVTRHAAETE